MAQNFKLPPPVQGLIDRLLTLNGEKLTRRLPAEIIEWFNDEGIDFADYFWEEAGELCALEWPPTFLTDFNDEEVVHYFGVDEQMVTDSLRIARTRQAINPAEFDDNWLSVIPVPVQSAEGVKGYICLIGQIQGQSGVSFIDSWMVQGDALCMN